MRFENILALSAHTDDIEVAAGGTIAKFIEQGSFVKLVAFSWCDLEILKSEQEESVDALGIQQFQILDFKRRIFPAHRQEILDFLISERAWKDWDLVLVPSTYDVHQDHQVISQEAIRAFKERSTIWGYEISHDLLKSDDSIFIKLSENDIWYKKKAVMCFSSQIEKHRKYFSDRAIMSSLESNGVRILTDYAEKFQHIRTIIK